MRILLFFCFLHTISQEQARILWNEKMMSMFYQPTRFCHTRKFVHNLNSWLWINKWRCLACRLLFWKWCRHLIREQYKPKSLPASSTMPIGMGLFSKKLRHRSQSLSASASSCCWVSSCFSSTFSRDTSWMHAQNCGFSANVESNHRSTAYFHSDRHIAQYLSLRELSHRPVGRGSQATPCLKFPWYCCISRR